MTSDALQWVEKDMWGRNRIMIAHMMMINLNGFKKICEVSACLWLLICCWSTSKDFKRDVRSQQDYDCSYDDDPPQMVQKETWGFRRIIIAHMIMMMIHLKRFKKRCEVSTCLWSLKWWLMNLYVFKERCELNKIMFCCNYKLQNFRRCEESWKETSPTRRINKNSKNIRKLEYYFTQRERKYKPLLIDTLKQIIQIVLHLAS